MEEVSDEPLYRDRVCGIDIGSPGISGRLCGTAQCRTPGHGLATLVGGLDRYLDTAGARGSSPPGS